MHPHELILEDVRCFQGEQRGRLRPITVLVGENSTGKSTFLACFSVIHQMMGRYDRSFDDAPDFNQEPFSMGSFRDIVRSRRGPSGRIDEFKLGIKLDGSSGGDMPTEVAITFVEQGSQPVPSSYVYRFGSSEFFELRRSESEQSILCTPGAEVKIDIPFSVLRFQLDYLLREKELSERIPASSPILSYIRDLLKVESTKGRERWKFRHDFQQPFRTSLVPVAPLRAKPKRTYDPVREIASPEGEHIPMLMMRLNHTEKSRWQSLHDGLVDFGRESGLFSDIKLRRHGKQISDPFQLQVKVRSGSHANIMDVGYGVSQSLPILVDLMARNGGAATSPRSRRAPRTFLLQQPEVHLHPKGQAELATLFAKSAKARSNRFLIETHSDHIVDRLRILVRKKSLKPDDVSIIFFEPQRNSVNVHSLTLDKNGNITDAPPGYRSFFLKETDRLLGFED